MRRLGILIVIGHDECGILKISLLYIALMPCCIILEDVYFCVLYFIFQFKDGFRLKI